MSLSQFDSILRMYADSGLRTVQDWIARGRDVETGAKSRLDTPHRGQILSLFSRDQTHVRARSQRGAS